MNTFKAVPWNPTQLPSQPPGVRCGNRSGVCADVDWIESILQHDYSRLVLCVGAGECPHLNELARRGYNITCCDLSRSVHLRGQAREINPANGIEIIRCQVDRLRLEKLATYDFCMTTGVFSMFERDDQDLYMLRQLAGALKPGGQLLLTALNAAYMLAHRPQELNPCTRRGFLQAERREQYGVCGTRVTGQRWYTERELSWLLNRVGLQLKRFFAVGPDKMYPSEPPCKDWEALGVLAVKAV